MNRRSIQILVYCGIFIAFSVVLTRFASIRFAVAGVENVRVGLGTFPILLAGIMFGPLFGALVGILADLAGFFISPMGAYMPHFTLVSAMYGLIPGLMMHLPLFASKNPLTLFRVRYIAGVVFSQLITQWILLPWFLSLTFQIPWQVSLIPRFITAPIQIVIFLLLGLALFAHPAFEVWIPKTKANHQK
jgi:ECF transporter S component (folate family)